MYKLNAKSKPRNCSIPWLALNSALYADDGTTFFVKRFELCKTICSTLNDYLENTLVTLIWLLDRQYVRFLLVNWCYICVMSTQVSELYSAQSVNKTSNVNWITAWKFYIREWSLFLGEGVGVVHNRGGKKVWSPAYVWRIFRITGGGESKKVWLITTWCLCLVMQRKTSGQSRDTIVIKNTIKQYC